MECWGHAAPFHARFIRGLVRPSLKLMQISFYLVSYVFHVFFVGFRPFSCVSYDTTTLTGCTAAVQMFANVECIYLPLLCVQTTPRRVP